MQKKIPMRQCVGCREMKAKKELVRVVRSPEGEISLDFRGKAPAAAHMSARRPNASGGRSSPGRSSGGLTARSRRRSTISSF